MKSLSVFLLLASIFLVANSTPSVAIEYYPDPVYQPLGTDDENPMSDIMQMATDGDLRAQFMLGDLYSKGKGGLTKNLTKAREWFELSAIHGYDYSFIRLAALEKRDKKGLSAWKWYTIAIRKMDYGDLRDYVLKARKDLVEKYKITDQDIAKMSKDIKEWEDKRDKRLEDDRLASIKARQSEDKKAEDDKKKAKAEQKRQANKSQAELDADLDNDLLQETVVASELEQHENAKAKLAKNSKHNKK